VTLAGLAETVKRDEEAGLQDAKTGEDITRSVLPPIILELENAKTGQHTLPICFLRQLLSFYRDQRRAILPRFLAQSTHAAAREQERMREQMQKAFGASPMDMMKMEAPMKMIEEQTRRNIEMFQSAMRMFAPGTWSAPNGRREAEAEPRNDAKGHDDIEELREQVAAMQRKLDALSKG